MFPAFSTALSALQADSTAIDVVGNNLANLNTTGYKASKVDFHDLMAQNLGPARYGAGRLGRRPGGHSHQLHAGHHSDHRRANGRGHSGQWLLRRKNAAEPDALHARRQLSGGCDGNLVTATGADGSGLDRRRTERSTRTDRSVILPCRSARPSRRRPLPP